MSSDSRDEENLSVGAADPGGIERRLEVLAHEMGELIECGRAGDREALHDYAVSLVRNRLPTAPTDAESVVEEENEETSAPGSGSGTNAATLIGYGFLLIPASAVLLLVFPPVGMLLFVTGVMLMGGGVMLALLTRMMSRSSFVAQGLRLFGSKTR